MKTTLRLTIVILMALTLTSAIAAAGGRGAEGTVYMLGSDGTWTALEGQAAADAEGLESGPIGRTGSSATWSEAMTIHLTVTDWLEYAFTGTRSDWQATRPGVFAADAVSFRVQSTNDLVVAFAGFESGPAATSHGGSHIGVYYWQDGLDAPAVPYFGDAWPRQKAVFGLDLVLAFAEVKDGLRRALWRAIVVGDGAEARHYEDSGTITLTLTDVAPFIYSVPGKSQG